MTRVLPAGRYVRVSDECGVFFGEAPGSSRLVAGGGAAPQTELDSVFDWLLLASLPLPLSLSARYCCCAPSVPRCGAVCSARACINHGGAARGRAQRGSLRRASASHEMCLQVREAPHSCRYNASSHSLHSPCLSILR